MAEKPRFYPAIVEKIVELSTTVKHFVLRYDESADSRFLAGQFLMVHLPKDGKPHKKSYSIASAPSLAARERRVELCIKLVEGGFVSTWFFRLKEGDRIETSIPYGVFTLPAAAQPVDEYVFVGTGTGIAPLRSMMLTLFEQDCAKPITLVFGNRFETDVLYLPEWEKLVKAHANFKFIPPVSRGTHWTSETAYVQDIVRRDFAGKLAGKHFFGCGLGPMCKALRETLLSMGAEKPQIHFELFI